ncbi:S1C family serine protease [Roseovarius arcticus]|uniref:S1C family serine protease n=1 Tax=Roseovarius arcticus TaxID=2547404 RepID=UPI00110FFCF0|nr:serine protease [Roseovarius arcticus]
MLRLIKRLILMFALVASPCSVGAQDYSKLLEDFDAHALTQTDKRFLQAALAFEGYYYGLLDGDWGAKSRDAMSRYSRVKFKGAPEDWHMAVLALSLFERIDRDGWRMDYFDGLGMSFLFPVDSAIADPPTKDFVNWRHRNSSLSYSLGIHDKVTTQNLHDFTVRQHEISGGPYTVRKTNFAVTSSTSRDGSSLYTRSNFVNGHWSTVMLSASNHDGSILAAVSSSISAGNAPSLMVSENGRLEAAILQMIAFIDEDREKTEEGNSLANSNQQDAPSGGSGSGFFVSSGGYVLTNEHVVSDCRKIEVNGEVAELVEVSEVFDLAILKTTLGPHDVVAEFSVRPAKLNSDVTVMGYPYAGLLSGLNVTRGSVSALKGLRGELTQMQISAPVQAGNSGGPVLATNGEVVGVVVSKLDAKLISDAIGDVPQNVNFAIRGEIAKLFLSQNGVDPTLGASSQHLLPEQLAEKASFFTAFIECKR